MLAGTVEIQMLADMARLREDVSTGVGIVERGSQKMQEVASLAGKALGLIGVTLSGAAFGSWIKGAIDSADALDEMSGRVNVSAKSLSELSLAYQLNGMDNAAMQTSLAKLSKQIVEGGGAFDTLGVKTRNADGSVREAMPVLYDLADAFANAEGKVEKVALAQEIFGKSGADMLPLLNGGSAGLREMADQAARLGLVIEDEVAANAAKFNDTLDLLGSGVKGVATQTAAQLLPTLNSLTGALLEAATDSDTLAAAADILAGGLKLLFTGGVLVVETFSTVGKTLAGVAGAAVAVAKGEFTQAKNILGAMGDDITAGWSKSAATIAKAWDDSGNKSVSSLTAVSAAQRRLALQTNEEAAESKKLADQKAAQAKKEAEDYGKLIDKIREKTLAIEQETVKGRALTEAEKLGLEITSKYTGAKREQALAALASLTAAEEERKARDLATKATEAAIAARLKEAETITAGVLKLEEEIEAQRAANATTLTGVDGTAQLTIAKLRDAAASADRKALVALERQEDEVLYSQLKLQADKLRELADLKEQGIHVKAAKDAADAWTKTTEQIGQGLTDSLYRAFESGKGFFETLWDGITNTFKTTVLKLVVQAVMSPVNGIINGVLGTAASGAANGGGGLGSLLSMGSSLYSLGSSMYSAGASYLAGSMSGANAAGSMYANLTGTGLDGLLATNGAYGTAGGTAGSAGAAGSNAAAAGWVALAVVAAMKASSDWSEGFRRDQAKDVSDELGLIGWGAFGAKSEMANLMSKIGFSDRLADILSGSTAAAKLFGRAAPRIEEQGITGSFAAGDFSGQAYANVLEKGGLFRSDKRYTNFADMPAEIAGALDAGAKSIYSSLSGYLDALSIPTTGLSAVTSQIKFKLTDSSDQNAQALKDAYTTYTNALLTSVSSYLAPFQKAGETLEATLSRLSTLRQFSDVLNNFGGVFSNIANLSIAAKESLIQFAGGMDALLAKTQQFVADYYTESERAGLQAKGILDVLQALGINGGGLGSREDFRALAEGLGSKLDNTDAQRQFAALLDIGPQFAQVADYLQKQGTTLSDLAAQAPQTQVLQLLKTQQDSTEVSRLDSLAASESQIALLQQQVEGQGMQVEAAQQTVEAVNTMNESIIGVQQALQAGLQVLADKLDQVVSTAAENASYIAGSSAQRVYAQP